MSSAGNNVDVRPKNVCGSSAVPIGRMVKFFSDLVPIEHHYMLALESVVSLFCSEQI